MTHKYLYIPIEVKVRELHGKILLAAVAASRGYHVIFGRKAELMGLMPKMPRGTFIGLWAQENFLAFFKTLKQRDFYTVVMDEEGLVTFSDAMYRNLKLSDQTLSFIDTFMTWGNYQSRVVGECNPVHTPEIVATGNVRFDVLRPEFLPILQDEVANIKQEFGKTILVISSFGLANHFEGAENYFNSLKKNMVIRTLEEEAFLRNYAALQSDAFKGLLEAIPALAQKFPDHTIIIRPHPSENHAPWAHLAKEYSNIALRHDGNVHSWVLASNVIVHHFCTTALEAYAAGIPAIAFRPRKDDTLETNLPYWGSLEAKNTAELLIKAEDIIQGRLQELKDIRAKAQPILETYIQNLGHHLACDVMMDIIDRRAPIAECRITNIFIILHLARNLIVDLLRRLKRKFLRNQKNYVDHKFAALTPEDIVPILEFLAQIRPELSSLKLTPLDKFTYRLHAD